MLAVDPNVEEFFEIHEFREVFSGVPAFHPPDDALSLVIDLAILWSGVLTPLEDERAAKHAF